MQRPQGHSTRRSESHRPWTGLQGEQAFVFARAGKVWPSAPQSGAPAVLGPLSWGFGVWAGHTLQRADRQSGSQALPMTSGDWRLGPPVVGIRGARRVFTRPTQDVGAPRKGPCGPLALCPSGGRESPGQRLPGGTWPWEAEQFPAGVFQAWPEAPRRGSRGARNQNTRGRGLS